VRILALVKYSFDIAELRVNPETEELRMRGVPERFGDIDKNVVEAAVRLKEEHGGTVRVLTVGGPAARTALKEILAMGVDDGVFVVDPFEGGGQPSAMVDILEAAIGRSGQFDLLLCGFASDDGYTSQTGPRLAERLSLPLVSYAQELSVAGDVLTATRDLKDHTQGVRVVTPAVVTIAEESFTPRSVTLLDAMKAQKKPVEDLTVEELGLEVEALEARSEFIELSRKGVVVRRRQEILKGEDQDVLADRLIDVLVRDGVLFEEA